MRIVIVEPHSDDAWINLGGFILKNPTDEFKIITICNDELNNKNETKKLEKIFPNIKTTHLKYTGMLLSDHKKILPDNYIDYFISLNRKFFWNGYKIKNFRDLEEKIEHEITSYDYIFLPFGAYHPQHVIISKITSTIPMRYYLDFPYRFNSDIDLFELISKSVKIDVTDVLDKKIRIFNKIYQSQIAILEVKSKLGISIKENTVEYYFPHAI